MTTEKSLFATTYQGALWTLIDVFFSKGFPLVIIIILARILGPEEFGLYGILVIFIAFGILISESGITTSLIRHHKLSKADYSTVFYLNFMITALLSGLIILMAPFIASFFHKPALISPIRAIALSYMIGAFTSVHLAILNKKMRFRKIAMLNMPGAIIGGLLGLFLATKHFGIWSVVCMNLTIQSITSALLWGNIKWRPSFEYSSVKASMHFKFGIYMLLSGFLETLFKNSYNIIIGKFYPIQSLAFYERARSMQEYPTIGITAISNKVSYPLLAKLQNTAGYGNTFFRKLIQVTFFINTPFILILAGIAHPIFYLILGKEWMTAVPYFQILCLSSIFYPHHAYNLNALKVLGRSDLFLRLEVIKKILMVVIIIISAPFGITGLLWGMVATSVIALYINIYYSGHFIAYSFKEQILELLPNLVTGIAAFFITKYVCNQLQSFPLLMQICIAGSIGLLSFFSMNFLINRKELFRNLNAIVRK